MRRSSDEEVAVTEDPRPHEDRLVQATEWLNMKLLPWLGPPPLGPYDRPELDPPDAVAHKPCPICGRMMSEHRVEASRITGKVFLYHPDESIHEVLETGRMA